MILTLPHTDHTSCIDLFMDSVLKCLALLFNASAFGASYRNSSHCGIHTQSNFSLLDQPDFIAHLYQECLDSETRFHHIFPRNTKSANKSKNKTVLENIYSLYIIPTCIYLTCTDRCF